MLYVERLLAFPRLCSCQREGCKDLISNRLTTWQLLCEYEYAEEFHMLCETSEIPMQVSRSILLHPRTQRAALYAQFKRLKGTFQQEKKFVKKLRRLSPITPQNIREILTAMRNA